MTRLLFVLLLGGLAWAQSSAEFLERANANRGKAEYSAPLAEYRRGLAL